MVYGAFQRGVCRGNERKEGSTAKTQKKQDLVKGRLQINQVLAMAVDDSRSTLACMLVSGSIQRIDVGPAANCREEIQSLDRLVAGRVEA